MVKDLLRLRYTLLPMWYTAFRETTVSGVPILKYGPTFLLNDTFHNLVL
jgi:alpha-glucosidase (family GH31 glycosyl hydrolase)